MRQEGQFATIYAVQHTLTSPTYETESTWLIFSMTITVSTIGIGVLYAISVVFQIGWNWPCIAKESFFGVLLAALLWFYHLPVFARFAWLIRTHWGVIETNNIRIIRLLTSFLLAWSMSWVFEAWDATQIGRLIDQTAPVDYVNETRGCVSALLIFWAYVQAKTSRSYYRSKLEIERLRHDNTIAQFELLKCQINPHFLFNSINILKTMIKSGNQQSEEYIMRMAEFYRRLLVTDQREKIPLAEEVAMLENYVFMLKARFENKLQIHIAQNACKCFLPPFTLQMLVENCIKHNVVSARKPLRIDICCDPNYITVRNNLQPKRGEEAEGNQTGLQNINQRYLALIDQAIHVEKNEQYFTVRLPLIK